MTLKVLRLIFAAICVVLVVVIFWIDISTDVWQDYVVLSGMVAGLVTFALTALVIDRVIARSTHERWVPVTRLALGDLRRRLVADTGVNAPSAVRRLPKPDDAGHAMPTLIAAAAAERDALTMALARWASFLSASADVLDIMDAIAEVSERLDAIDRTAKIAPVPHRELVTEIDAYHRAGDRLLSHIDAALDRYDRMQAA